MKVWFPLLLCLLLFRNLPVAGQQWVEQSLPKPSGSTIFSVNIIEVVDTSTVWAVRNKEVLKTTNGGRTWQAFPVPDPNAEGFQIQSLAAVDSSTAWLTAINYQLPNIRTRVMKTADGGRSWHHQTSAYPKPVSFAYGIHFFDADNGVVLGYENPTTAAKLEIYTTSNGGDTWVRVPDANLPPPVANISYNTFVEAFSVVGNSIWFANANPALIYRSPDRGLHWTVSPLPFPPPAGSLYFSVAFSDALNGLACRNRLLARTTDGGLTWTNISPGGPFHTSKLAAVPGSPGTYFSGDYYQSRNGSSITYDHGHTWLPVETYMQHFDLEFAGPEIGWSGGNGALRRFSPHPVPPPPPPPVFSDCFTVSPVPSAGALTITPCQPNVVFNLRIYDATGRKIYQRDNYRNGVLNLDLSNYAAGMYLLQVLSGEKQFLKKFVLKP